MKKNHSLKWALIGAALTVIFMYGLDMASSGIERVYGPIQQQSGSADGEQRESASSQPSGSPQAAIQAGETFAGDTEQPVQTAQPPTQSVYGPHLQDRDVAAYQPLEPRLPGAYGEYREPTVNRMADQTAGMLQSLSSSGIRLVVSLFDSFTN